MATISGLKWNDVDADGVKDTTEPGLANWTIFLDTNQNGQLDTGETSTTTDANGNYTFTNLAAGTYTVTDVVQSGWEKTFPLPLNSLSLNFGEFGGNLNLNLNGEFRNFGNFSELNGQTIGGVAITVANGLGNDAGTLQLAGTIKSLAIGGQELWLDNIQTNGNDTAFETLTPGLPFPVGTVLDDAGVSITVEPFTLDNGTPINTGFAEVETGGLAGGTGQELQVNNVNLRFDFSPNAPTNGIYAITVGADETVAGINFGNRNVSPVLPTLSISDVSITEGNSGFSTMVFTVNLSTASQQSITVNYATADGTAIAPQDYTATTGTLTFAPNQTSQTIAVQIAGDTIVEPDEIVVVNLTNPTNATIADSQGIGTILNDEALPPVGQVISGTSGADTLAGTAGEDTITGLAGGDRLTGRAGNDTIKGNAGPDLLRGGGGDDTLNGNAGNDTIKGGPGNDTLNGGAGDDSILGGAGDDLLVGGRGTDELTGGNGADAFVYRSLGDAIDTITDFQIGQDLIDLSQIFLNKLNFTSPNPFQDYVQLFQLGSDTVVRIDASGDTTPNDFRFLVVLENTQAANLGASSFVV